MDLSKEEIERAIKELEDNIQIHQEEIFEKERVVNNMRKDLFKLQCQLRTLTQ